MRRFLTTDFRRFFEKVLRESALNLRDQREKIRELAKINLNYPNFPIASETDQCTNGGKPFSICSRAA
ncbi:MAG TPA: hypothetical protein VLN72_09225, partial [Gillisia sp.]|nr:hypothetical protein [Gillisia sp.]